MPNIIFATMHLTFSLKLAIPAFFMGIFWGWLYSRHKTVLGVMVSHMLIGFWLLFVLGVQDIVMR